MSNHPAHKPLVACLSPDILFIIARLAYPDIGDGSAKLPVDPYVKDDSHFKDSFADLAQVCRHWRHAFLSCPSFWTKLQIPERSVWYLEEKLIRSAGYSLKITVHCHQQFSTEMLSRQFNVLFTHLHRIQSLIIQQTHGYHKPIPNYILSLITNPAPMLEVFHFDFTAVISLKRLISGSAERRVPETLFANHAPKLTELRITALKLFRNNLPNFKTIRRLSLVFVYGLTQYGLLNILEAVSCNLEALEIVTPSHLPWPFELCKDRRPAISVSSLQTLRLWVGVEVLLVVLSHTTDIPLDVKWDINCGDLISGVDIDTTPFVLFLARIRKGDHNIFLFYDEIHVKFGQTPSGPYNSLRFFMGALCTEEHVMRLETIFSTMNLSNVKSCELTCHGQLLPFWMEVYERMFQPFLFLLNQMEKLSIACDNILALIQYLRPRTTETMRIILPCPLLRDLKVRLVTSTDEASGLVQDLVARKEAGNTLTNLCVEYKNDLKGYLIKQDWVKLAENVEMIGKTPRTS